MNPLFKAALNGGALVNEKAAAFVSNGMDRLFNAEELIRSSQTPYDVILVRKPMSLRYYPPLVEGEIPLTDGSMLPVERKEKEVPLLIIPPLAASAHIFDLMPQRSMVRYFRARGYKVYMIDWGEPAKRYARLGVKDYAEDMLGEAIETVREHSKVQAVSLLGWCMGGLFALIYGGLSHDENVKNIITIASPIDSRQGGAAGQVMALLEPVSGLVRRYTGFRVHKIDPKYLQVPGWVNSLTFKLTNPVGSLTTYWDLLMNLADREFVVNHTTTSDFLDNMHHYPGGIIQDFMIKLGVDNDFSRGRIEIGDKTAALDRIESSLLVFAGEKDAIVSADAAEKSMDLVASKDKRFEVAPGGHAGVVMSAKAQTAVWGTTADWLATRSSLK
jgi:polyhydroxyalkanoate synthase